MTKTELQIEQDVARIRDIIEEYASNPKEYDLFKTAVEIYSIPMEGKRVCPFNNKILCEEVECLRCPIWDSRTLEYLSAKATK